MCVMTALRYAAVLMISIFTGPIMPMIFIVKQNPPHGLGLTKLLSPWNSLTAWYLLFSCKGQPLSHIFASNQDSVSCSIRTLYNYIDQGYFTAINLDLPRKVRYKKRRKARREPDNTGIEKAGPIRILSGIWKSFQIQM